MLDLDIVFKQRIANRFASGRINHGALGAQRMVRKNNDLGHF